MNEAASNNIQSFSNAHSLCVPVTEHGMNANGHNGHNNKQKVLGLLVVATTLSSRNRPQSPLPLV